MLDFPEMNGQTRLPKPEQHSPLPMFSAPRSDYCRLDTLATLCGDELFLTTPTIFLRFPWKNWPFLVLFTVNCFDLAAMVIAFVCPLTYAGKTEEFFMQRLRSLSGAPSSTPLLPFLTSGPDFGA